MLDPRTEFEGVILGHEAIEVLSVLERVSCGHVTFEARNLFVSTEALKRSMRRVVINRENILLAFERRDAFFERGDLRVEVPDYRATVILSRVEKDASQGRRSEGMVFLWDDGQVGRH
jgi:hypothetical protein